MSIVRYIDETDDRLEISNVYEQSWKSAYKGMIPQDYLDSIPSGRWAAKVDNPDWHTLVCVEDEKIVGTSSFCESRFDTFPGYGEVISIYLLPEYVGRGHGRQLMEKALSELKQMGYKKVMLWCWKRIRMPEISMNEWDFNWHPRCVMIRLAARVYEK